MSLRGLDQTYAYFDRARGNVLANLQKIHAKGRPIDWTEWRENIRKMSEQAGGKSQ